MKLEREAPLLFFCSFLLSLYSLCFHPSLFLALVRCPSQLPAAAHDYLVWEPAWSEAAVRGGEVLDSAGGHRRFALPGHCLLDNAMQQGMNTSSIFLSSSLSNHLH